MTGTPINNRLEDYGSLLAFIRVPPFESRDGFHFWVSQAAKWHAKSGLERLRKLVSATCLRRTKALVQDTLSLPKKIEVQQLLNLGEDDKELYQFFARSAAEFLRNPPCVARNATKTVNRSRSILPIIGILRLICDHGEALLPANALQAWRQRDCNAVNWSMLSSVINKCESCGLAIEEMGDLEVTSRDFNCSHTICNGCSAYGEDEESSLLEAKESCPKCSGRSPLPNDGRAAAPHDTNEGECEYRPSAKVTALLESLRGKEDASQDVHVSKRYQSPSPKLNFGCPVKLIISQVLYSHIGQECSILCSKRCAKMESVFRELMDKHHCISESRR